MSGVAIVLLREPCVADRGEMSTELVHYDAAMRELAIAHKLDEVKDIRDKALALEIYARQANNLEAEDRCKEIRIRAERKWGQLYSASEKAPAGRPRNSSNETRDFDRPKTLDEICVSYDQSSKWQKLGEVPDDEFEAAVAERRVEQLTAKPEMAGPVEPVNANVLWLWGRLREFRDRGLLAMTPDELEATATAHMATEINELAPVVGDWLLQWR